MVSSKRASLGRLRHSASHPLPNGTVVARYEERPLRHPDSPAKRKRGGVNMESAKANPLLGIAGKCPERRAKDLGGRMAEHESAKANPFEQSNRIAKLPNEAKSSRRINGFVREGEPREAAALGQAPPPRWHNGRQIRRASITPSGLPREEKTRGSGREKCKSKPTSRHRREVS
jgi:hypothetical protein